jgi:hypothetical protein
VLHPVSETDCRAGKGWGTLFQIDIRINQVGWLDVWQIHFLSAHIVHGVADYSFNLVPRLRAQRGETETPMTQRTQQTSSQEKLMTGRASLGWGVAESLNEKLCHSHGVISLSQFSGMDALIVFCMERSICQPAQNGIE